MLDEADPPVTDGLKGLIGANFAPGVVDELPVLTLLRPRFRPKPLDEYPPAVKPPFPVVAGLMPLFLGPMQVGNLDGLAAWATRLKAPMHCSTCAGSFFS